MKYILIIVILALIPGDIDKIAKVNKLKQEAKEAYLNGDYETALSKYQYLTDSLGVKDDNISLNLANAYYNTKDTAQAINGYSSLLNSSSKLIRSTANQQLGVISTRNKKFKEALDHFKEALRADPANEDARYNYEMMKKILEEQEQQQQQQNQQNQDQQDQKDQQQNQDQQQQQQNQEGQDQDEQNQQQDEQQQEQEGESEQEQEQQEGKEQEQEQQEGEQEEQEQQEQQEGEESDEKKQEEQANSISEKLEEMKISEEKAKMILEALKNKEIQYYQQTKKKPTKRKDPNKPDW